MFIKENTIQVEAKSISIQEKYRDDLTNVEVRELKKGYISDLLISELPKFNKYRAIILSTQPGSGKTTFFEKTTPAFALSNKKGKVIIVSNRIAQDIAIKKRIAKKLGIYNDYNDAAIHQMTDFGNIIFLTYQQLKIRIRDGTINDKGIAFAVFDEVHYFTSDATFSKDNGWLLLQLPKIFSNTVRIYITATVKEVLPYICLSECNPFAISRWKKRWLQDSYYNKIYNDIAVISEQEKYELLLEEQFAYNEPTPILYEQMPDFSHIKLRFYKDNEDIEDMLMQVEGKAIIFVNTKERGQALHQQFPDSEYMDAETKVKNPEFLGDLVQKEVFDKKFLITTSVFENGCNIKDDEVKTIVIENISPTSIIQMVGRRRKCHPTDTFSLYLKIPTVEHLRQLRYLSKETLRLVLNAEDYPNLFMRELINPAVVKTLESIISVDAKRYKFDWLTKSVLRDNIDYYSEIIECISKHGIRGYCSKIAKDCFGQEFHDKMLPHSSEHNIRELLAWLDSYTSKIFDEDEFREFVAEFKRKYTFVVGISNSDNRGKQRQDVGHTWFNNRMKKLSLSYEVATLSGGQYLLVKRECANCEI